MDEDRDDIITQLRECNEPVPVPLELPDEDLLVEIEEQLTTRLPDDYKAFLLTVSDVVCGNLEPATAADPQSHTYLPEVAANAWDRGLPRHYVPICAHDEGYYCIDRGGAIGYWPDGGSVEKGKSEDEDGHEEYSELSQERWENIWQWAKEVWLNS